MRWQIWLILMIFAWAACGAWASDATAFLPGNPKYFAYAFLTCVPLVTSLFLMISDLKARRNR